MMLRNVMPTCLLPLLLSLSPCGDSQIVNVSAAKESSKVFICTGGSSKRYHKTRSCHGLNNCKGTIKEVTIGYAKDLGKTPCKICYK